MLTSDDVNVGDEIEWEDQAGVHSGTVAHFNDEREVSVTHCVGWRIVHTDVVLSRITTINGKEV